MKTNPKNILLEIASKSLLSAGTSKIDGPTVRTEPATPVTGWDLIKPEKVKWHGKPIEGWNKRDIISYFFHCYFAKYGVYLDNQNNWAYNHSVLSELITAIEIQFGLEKCSNLLLKEFFDYFFDRFSDGIIATLKPSYNISLRDLKKNIYVRSFYLYKQNETKISGIDFETSSKGADRPIGLEDFENAYNIHGQYFCENYGILLVGNFLMIHKGFDIEKTKQYIAKVMKKSKKDDIIAVTKKYEPYPKWFKFIDVSDFLSEPVQFSDIDTYDFLRSSKK